MADSDCIFCKIVTGEIPAEVVLQDSVATAFMDVGPLAEGHVLLVPAGHYETIDQMPADEAAAMLRHVPALVKAVQAATGCEGVNVLQNNGRAAHQVVMHVHVHIIPRNSGDAFGFTWPAGEYAAGKMSALASAIRGYLPG